MQFSMKKDPRWDAEVRKIGATLDDIENAIRDELIATASYIRNHIITSMRKTPKITRPKKNKVTGSSYGNYNWIIGGKTHIPSSPGYAPAVASGALIRSIKMDVREREVEVGSNITGKGGGYPVFLELGTKFMEPRPYLEPAFDAGERELLSTIRQRVLSAIRNKR